MEGTQELTPVQQPGPVPQETIAFSGLIREEEKAQQAPVSESSTYAEKPDKEVDFQEKLEESLKDL